MYYFGYGINTNTAHMAARAKTATCLGKAHINDYRFRFAYHADIVPSIGDQVDGVAWLITDHDLAELDILEGYPKYYTRIKQQVTVSGKCIDAWVYIMQPGPLDSVPGDYYYEMVVNGYNEHQVPLTQINIAMDVALKQHNNSNS